MKKSIEEQVKIIKKVMNNKNHVPEYRFNFGKYKGKTLDYVYSEIRDFKYLAWVYNNSEKINPVLEKFIEDKLV
jgi:hypothetical protein